MKVVLNGELDLPIKDIKEIKVLIDLAEVASAEEATYGDKEKTPCVTVIMKNGIIFHLMEDFDKLTKLLEKPLNIYS